MIKILLREWSSSTTIFILTARALSAREVTLELLKKYKIPFHMVIFRENHLMDTEDEEWKLGKINEFAEKYKNIIFYEDKPDNIAYFRKGIKGSSEHRFILVGEDGTHMEMP